MVVAINVLGFFSAGGASDLSPTVPGEMSDFPVVKVSIGIQQKMSWDWVRGCLKFIPSQGRRNFVPGRNGFHRDARDGVV